MDEVGIDVGHKVGKILQEAYGPRLAAPPGMEKLVADGRHGRKTKKGFYRYEGSKTKQVDPAVYAVLGVEPTLDLDPQEIADRCVLLLANEAVRCLEEGVLRSARDGDMGAIFGLGFPPFRGGPFRMIDALGPQETVARLRSLEDRHGERFTPAPLLVRMAAENSTFYDAGRSPPIRAGFA